MIKFNENSHKRNLNQTDTNVQIKHELKAQIKKISENIYLQITFTYWEVSGGGFAYTRTTQTGCFTKSKTFASICQGQSYNFNGNVYTTSGTYTKTGLTNAAGCDSTATLKLTVNSINTAAISEAGSALMLDGVNGYVSIPRAISGDFTYEYWIKTTSSSPTGYQWYQGTGIVDAEVGGVTNDFGTSLLNGKLAFCFGKFFF